MKRNKSTELADAVDRLLGAAAKLKPKNKSSEIKDMIAAARQMADATVKLIRDSKTSNAAASDPQRHHATTADHLNRGARLLNAEIGLYGRCTAPFWKRA
jgi:hypothetical protein